MLTYHRNGVCVVAKLSMQWAHIYYQVHKIPISHLVFLFNCSKFRGV